MRGLTTLARLAGEIETPSNVALSVSDGLAPRSSKDCAASITGALVEASTTEPAV
jgi:hypothetical protein